MSRDGTWGDELTLRAICEALAVVVNVISSGECAASCAVSGRSGCARCPVWTCRSTPPYTQAHACARRVTHWRSAPLPLPAPPGPPAADRDHWFLRYIPSSTRPRHECFLTYVAPIHYNAVR